MYLSEYPTVPNYNQEKIIRAFLDETCQEIKFSESDCSHYSIQKICSKAESDYGLGAGEWFNPSNICFILRDLHQERPLEGSENLRIVLFNTGIICLDQMLGEDFKMNAEKENLVKQDEGMKPIQDEKKKRDGWIIKK